MEPPDPDYSPDLHNLPTTMATHESVFEFPNKPQSSFDEQTLSSRTCPFRVDGSGTTTERRSYAKSKQRSAARTSVGEIEAVLAQFKSSKDNFTKKFVPMQTYELKRKGAEAAVTLPGEDMDGDGDASVGSGKEETGDLTDLMRKFEKFEEQIEGDERKNKRKREVSDQKSEGVRKARFVVNRSVAIEGGDMRMSVDVLKRLGRAAPMLSVKELSEMVVDKFSEMVVKRTARVKFATAFGRRITRHQKVYTLHANRLLRLYRHFLTGLHRLNRRLPVPVHGLPNLGNTCFMNAALNMLFYTPPVNEFMKKINGHSGVELAVTFQRFCNAYQREDVTGLLYEMLRHLPEFSGGMQKCSHSFLLKFLSKIDKDLNCVSQLPPSLLSSPYSSRFANYQRNKCKEMHALFSGLTENVFTCSKCFGCWQNYSYWRTMDIPITDTAYSKQGVTYFGPMDFYNEDLAEEYQTIGADNMKAYTEAFQQWDPERLTENIPVTRQTATLDLCLKYMLRANLMTASNTFECEHCHQETQHFKQSFLRHVGNVLTVHLQRYNEATGNKLDTYVACPDTLTLSSYLPSASKYRLSGVVNHYGSLSGGHYTAYVRAGGSWFLVNDSSVSKVEPGTDLCRAAYVVTYVREEA